MFTGAATRLREVSPHRMARTLPGGQRVEYRVTGGDDRTWSTSAYFSAPSHCRTQLALGHALVEDAYVLAPHITPMQSPSHATVIFDFEKATSAGRIDGILQGMVEGFAAVDAHWWRWRHLAGLGSVIGGMIGGLAAGLGIAALSGADPSARMNAGLGSAVAGTMVGGWIARTCLGSLDARRAAFHGTSLYVYVDTKPVAMLSARDGENRSVVDAVLYDTHPFAQTAKAALSGMAEVQTLSSMVRKHAR